MIPVKLYLKNFMSYGGNVPPMEFTDFHIACLCGNNGHGKSAIIDAITWVLWGEGRKTSAEKKASDGLLKIGATEMMVEFIFDLEGDRFRVIRQYSKSGNSSKTTLEFEVFEREKNEFITLTQKSISQTQEKINEFLRMNYDVFINSSAILQGRADEFATKKAGERKQLLADILGLFKYDELSEKAWEKYREASMRINFIEDEKQVINETLFQKENVLEKLRNIKEDLEKLNNEINIIENALISLREKKNKLTFIKEQLTGINEQIKRDENTLEEQKKQKLQMAEEIERLKNIIKDEENIIKAYDEYEKLIKQESIMMEKIQKMTRLRQKKNSIDNKINQKRNEITSEIDITKEKINSIKSKLKDNIKIMEERENIENNFRQLEELEKKEKNLEENFRNQKKLEDIKRKIERSINEKEGLLKIEMGTLENQRKETERKIFQIETLSKEIKRLREKTSRSEELTVEKDETIKKGLEKRTHIDRIKEKIKELEKETEDDRERWKTISKTKIGKCPLCEAPLDQERKRKTLEKIKKEADSRKNKISDLGGEIKKIEEERNSLLIKHKEIMEELALLEPEKSLLAQKEMELKECEKGETLIINIKHDIEKIERKIKEKKYAEDDYKKLEEIQEKLTISGYNEEERENIKLEKEKLENYRNLKIKLDFAIEEKNKLDRELPELEKRAGEKEKILEKEDFAPELKEELLKIEKELASLDYSGEEHNSIRERIKKLSRITTQKVLLDDARKQLPARKEKIINLDEKIQEIEKILKQLKVDKEEKTALLSELPLLEEEIPQREIALQGIRLRVTDLTLEKGNLESLSDTYKRLEEKLNNFTEELELRTKEKNIYKILNRAFGKDGIQALIIQNCIPEIETEANKLLSRLTDNRIHLTLELLRVKKSGGLKETLDIKISDEVGTRDYELYSGGEAFRTNFALRVALAKLLARRAGTKLRTLIIDEGFGTQDTEGLEQLVQVIQEAGKDFDKIIVITHMESLKNFFPTRIEISKSSSGGSSFRVIHN